MRERTVTVAVPPALYDQLEQRAAQAARSVEDEVVLTLAAAIPPEDRLSPDLEETLASMSALDDEALWRVAHSRVTDEDGERLADLADKRQRAGLTPAELREAEELAHLHDRSLLFRGQAAALLKQRGHDVSVLLPRA